MRIISAYATAIPLGRRLPGASSNLPERPGLDIDPEAGCARAQSPLAVPIRSCSRWGLPCRRRCRRRGALLPHRFTLAAPPVGGVGGLFSVALSLGSHPPDVIRHRLSTEPGLSSPAALPILPACGKLVERAEAAVRPTDQQRDGEVGARRQEARRPISRARAEIVLTRPRVSSKSRKVARVEASAAPSTRSWRKWRWKALTTSWVTES